MPTPNTISATQMHRIPACTRNECGPDGRNCKTREACELPSDDGQDMKDTAWAILTAVVFFGITGSFALWAWENWELLALAFGR